MMKGDDANKDGQLPYPYATASPQDALLSNILNALHWNSTVPQDHIKVELNGGVVVLTGCAETAYARDMAAKTALDVSGVVEVINRIIVEPPAHSS